MQIIRRNPGFGGAGFGDLFSLRNEMNQLFENFFGRSFFSPVTGVFPPVNLYYDDNNVYLTAELPGMDTNDIEINMENESVSLKGERKIPPENENGHYHRREREGGSFARTISLPIAIAAEKVKAELQNGVLKLVMPKAEEAKPIKIEINVE